MLKDLKNISDSASGRSDGSSGRDQEFHRRRLRNTGCSDGRQVPGEWIHTPQAPIRLRSAPIRARAPGIPQRRSPRASTSQPPTHRMHPTHAMGLQVGAHTMQLASQRMARSRRAAQLRVGAASVSSAVKDPGAAGRSLGSAAGSAIGGVVRGARDASNAVAQGGTLLRTRWRRLRRRRRASQTP